MRFNFVLKKRNYCRHQHSTAPHPIGGAVKIQILEGLFCKFLQKHYDLNLNSSLITKQTAHVLKNKSIKKNVLTVLNSIFNLIIYFKLY